jgi:hypothetical protein
MQLRNTPKPSKTTKEKQPNRKLKENLIKRITTTTTKIINITKK